MLRLIQFATEAALRLRMPVSVCGEMAANPRLVPLLLGLGLRSLSMNASAIPRVKQVVRALNIDDCARFARRVMEQSDPARIQELVWASCPAPTAAERAAGWSRRPGISDYTPRAGRPSPPAPATLSSNSEILSA